MQTAFPSFSALGASLVAVSLLTVVQTNAHAADAEKGAAYFQTGCSSCHSVDINLTAGQGPALRGVIGRTVGTAPKFPYSEALQKAGASGTKWNEESLSQFLLNPEKSYPGTRMPLNVPKAVDRANLIAYLTSLKASAVRPVDPSASAASEPVIEDWRDDAPGKVHRLNASDLPKPYFTKSASNSPSYVKPAAGLMPIVPKGFKVTIFATGTNARSLVVAPNGDVFVSDRGGKNIKVFRSFNGETADTTSVFAEGFNNPYGIAFYPNNINPTHLYVASITNVVRYPYKIGDLKPSGPAEVIIPVITDVGGNHSTRSLLFTPDGKLMLLTVGSATNVATEIAKTAPEAVEQWDAKHGIGGAWGVEENRAAIFSFNPDGSNKQVYATGIRNCVGFAIHPATNDVLCSVNERDGLGDNLPPDYFSRIPKNAFFGWPWYYTGDNEDPRHANLRPDLKGKVRVPDVLIQPHSAPLGMAVYQAAKSAKNNFGKNFDGDVFLALHGSWNRASRTGNKLIRIPMKNGVPSGEYEDFMTGMIISNNSVWARPSSVAIAQDGAVLVGDDAYNVIWRITPDEAANKKKK